MLKRPNFITKIQIFSLLFAILTSLYHLIGQNDQKHVQNTFHNHTDSKCVYLFNVASLIVKSAKIGTFWPFLATFGIESVTRLMKMFSDIFFQWKQSMRVQNVDAPLIQLQFSELKWVNFCFLKVDRWGTLHTFF